jgi:hypothetical protein
VEREWAEEPAAVWAAVAWGPEVTGAEQAAVCRWEEDLAAQAEVQREDW